MGWLRGGNKVGHKAITSAIAAAALIFGGAWGAQAISTDGFIDSKSAVPVPIVVVDGQPYQVTENTIFEGVQGERLELTELPALTEGADTSEAAAYLEWRRNGSQRVLESLELTGSDD